MTLDIFASKKPVTTADPALAGRVTAVENEITTARGGQANLDARLDANDSSVSGLASAYGSLNSEVTNARGGQANLDARLDLMTTATTAVTTEVTNARNQYANLDTRLDAELVTFSSLLNEVQQARGENATLELRLEEMQEDVGIPPGILRPPTLSLALAPLDINGDLIALDMFFQYDEDTLSELLAPYTPGDGMLSVLDTTNWGPAPFGVNGHYWIALGEGANQRVIKPAGTKTNLFWENILIPIGSENDVVFTEAIIDATNPAPGSGGVWPTGTAVQICGPVLRPYVAISARRLIGYAHWNEATALVQGTTVDKAVVDPALLPAGTDALGLMVVINS